MGVPHLGFFSSSGSFFEGSHFLVSRLVLYPTHQGLTPSGDFSFFSFAFNRFIIAYRAFRRTVSLDVSGLAGCNDRQAVSKFIVDHFAQYNIHEVQFICTVVTFAAEASKQQVLSHQVININGILCAVLGDGPCAQNVMVYNYPVEGNEELIRRKLGACGVIKNISFEC